MAELFNFPTSRRNNADAGTNDSQSMRKAEQVAVAAAVVLALLCLALPTFLGVSYLIPFTKMSIVPFVIWSGLLFFGALKFLDNPVLTAVPPIITLLLGYLFALIVS